MSATDNLSGHQFVDHLHEVPMTLSRHIGTEQEHVRMVPTRALDVAWSGEYGEQGHEAIAKAREQRLAEHETWDENLRHPGDNPGKQEALTEDVAKHGVKTPLYVSAHEGGEYGIANGTHRYLAAHAAGVSHVPVVLKR